MLKKILRWPFTTSEIEERAIDALNLWFGSVPGIKQVMIFLVLYVASQFFLPPHERFDPYPFAFLVLIVTLVSLTSNQWLMNKALRQEVHLLRQQIAEEQERRVHLQLTENSLSMMNALRSAIGDMVTHVAMVPSIAEDVEDIKEELEGDES